MRTLRLGIEIRESSVSAQNRVHLVSFVGGIAGSIFGRRYALKRGTGRGDLRTCWSTEKKTLCYGWTEIR